MPVFKHDKRYSTEGRQLCIGDVNTCTNLAGYKQTVRGRQIYHNECDKHRRHYHYIFTGKHKKSELYIPLKNCEWCGSEAKHRHRIDRTLGYKISNIIRLCLACHKLAHSVKPVEN